MPHNYTRPLIIQLRFNDIAGQKGHWQMNKCVRVNTLFAVLWQECRAQIRKSAQCLEVILCKKWCDNLELLWIFSKITIPLYFLVEHTDKNLPLIIKSIVLYNELYWSNTLGTFVRSCLYWPLFCYRKMVNINIAKSIFIHHVHLEKIGK